MISHFCKVAKSLGYNVVVVGYPKGIASNTRAEEVVNLWSYRQVLEDLRRTTENVGMELYVVNEEGSSSTCAKHGLPVQRGPRGWVECPLGHVEHADINAALNHLRKWNPAAPTAAKSYRILSFTAGPGWVKEKRRRAGANPAGRSSRPSVPTGGVERRPLCGS